MDKYNTIKLFLYSNRKKIGISLSILLLLCISLISYFVVYKKYKPNNKEIIINENILEKKEEIHDDIDKEYLYIDIKGNVLNPGVYSLEKGKRVVDAINIAGGLKENSDTSLLNMSMLLSDEMVIIIYSKDQIKSLEDTIKKESVKNTICNDNVKNDACSINSKVQIVPNIKNEIKEESISSEKININTADKQLLMTLSKIGESKALSIIEYREKNGLFKTIEDIKNVNGIGDSLFETIKDFITV